MKIFTKIILVAMFAMLLTTAALAQDNTRSGGGGIFIDFDIVDTNATSSLEGGEGFDFVQVNGANTAGD